MANNVGISGTGNSKASWTGSKSKMGDFCEACSKVKRSGIGSKGSSTARCGNRGRGKSVVARWRSI